MNRPVSNTAQIEERIEGKMDRESMALTEVSSAVGGLAFKDMGQVMEFAKLMSVSKQAVPNHLRGEPGACMAVSLQALNWRMDPFAVANKSYMVNDRIVYEAQLIQAVIEQRAPIKGRLKGEFVGEGSKRQCKLWCIDAEDGEKIEYLSPEIGSITTKNSPLWRADPDQQLWYYSARAMCRRHFPDVLLGIYEKEEIANAQAMRDVTPAEAKPGGFAAMAQRARQQEAPEEAQEATAEADEALDGEILPDEREVDPSGAEDEPQDNGGVPDEFNEGFDAFQSGVPASDCPYASDDIERVAPWMAGWKKAQMEEGESA